MKFIIALCILVLISCDNPVSDTRSAKAGTISTDTLEFASGMVKIESKNQKFSMGEDSLMYLYGPWSVDEAPSHQIRFTYNFYIDTTEVTVEEYSRIMGLSSSLDVTLPQTAVSWYDAVLYCNEKSKLDNLDTVYSYTSTSLDTNEYLVLDNIRTDWSVCGYRLPTEAEWEYSYKGNTDTRYYWGSETFDNHVWYSGNSDSLRHSVAQKIPNAFGLYDMGGNVWEWCNDNYESRGGLHMDYFYNYGLDRTNPAGPTGKYENRVIRGGSYTTDKIYYSSVGNRLPFASAWRNYAVPANPYTNVGFRVVLQENQIITNVKNK